MSTALTQRRERFGSWRSERPFWGGLTLAFAGLVIGIIPLDLAMRFALVPTNFAFVGLIFAVLVVLCGIFAVLQPSFASFFGTAGILLSVASLFGALGGFGIGTILGITGGALCVSWVHPDEVSDEDDLKLGVRSSLSSASSRLTAFLS